MIDVDDRRFLIPVDEDDDSCSEVILNNAKSGAVAIEIPEDVKNSSHESKPSEVTKKSFIKEVFPVWNFPYFILITSVLQIVYYFGCYMSEKETFAIADYCNGCVKPDHDRPGALIAGPFTFVAAWRNEIWRFWTYQFVHHNISHLAANMLAQFTFGVIFEMNQKTWRTAVIYTVGVLAGPLFYFALGDPRNVVGASNGGFALTTAALVMVFLKWNEIKHSMDKKVFYGVLAFACAGNIVFDYVNGEPPLYRHWAGIITGFCLAIVTTDHSRGRYLRFAFLLAYAVFFAWTIYATVTFPLKSHH